MEDVADVEDSVADVRTEGLANGKPSVVIIIFRQPNANIIDAVDRVRAMVPELQAVVPGGMKLKIVMDGANIFQPGQLPNMRKVLDGAFDLLGSDIALAHAKDLDKDGEAGHLAAGRGRLDYPYYLELLRKSGFEGTIILHALQPAEARDRLAFVRSVAPAGYL